MNRNRRRLIWIPIAIVLASLTCGYVVRSAAPIDESDRHEIDLKSDPRLDAFVLKNAGGERDAKAHHHFWLQSTTGEGYGLDVLASTELFAAVYPGYPDRMRTDETLWSDYFLRPFEVDAWVSGINGRLGRTFGVIQSWTGCLDIFRAYGADVILIGTSETFRTIVVDELSRKLAAAPGGPSANHAPRVLMCAGSALQFESASATIERLASARPNEHPIVIFGLSVSTAFVEGVRNLQNGREKMEEIAEYDFQMNRSHAPLIELFEKYHRISFSDLFPKLTWDDVFPSSWSATQKADHRHSLARKAVKVEPRAKDKGGFVLRALEGEPEQLTADITRRMSPYYRVFDDFTPDKCVSQLRVARLHDLFSRLQSFASSVYVFFPPVTPMVTGAEPECLRAQVRTDAEALAREFPTVTLRTDGWEAYGVGYGDYLRPTGNVAVDKLDIQHLNYVGAMKATTILADWITAGKVK